MKKILSVVVLFLVVLGVVGCNTKIVENDFYKCFIAISKAHPSEFESIAEIRYLASEIGNSTHNLATRETLSSNLRDAGSCYPAESRWNIEGSLVALWVDKEGKPHISIIDKKGEEISTGPLLAVKNAQP